MRSSGATMLCRCQHAPCWCAGPLVKPTIGRRGLLCHMPCPCAVQGFMWGSLTGFAEPVGGLIGYLAVHEQDPLSFAIVFGIVSGMMVRHALHTPLC